MTADDRDCGHQYEMGCLLFRVQIIRAKFDLFFWYIQVVFRMFIPCEIKTVAQTIKSRIIVFFFLFLENQPGSAVQYTDGA